MIIHIRKDPPPSMDFTNATDQPQSRLLALPPELRNEIWHLVLVQNVHDKATAHPLSRRHDPERHSRFCANVLRTCTQINAEGTPILYGENLFSAHRSLLATLPSLVLRLQQRPLCCDPVTNARGAKFIRRFHVFVRLDTDPRFSRRQVEDSFNGAEELLIDVFQAMYGSCDFSVLSLFEGVRGVGKVKIDGSLGDRKYADWLTEVMKLRIGEQGERGFAEQYVGGVRAWDAWAHGQR